MGVLRKLVYTRTIKATKSPPVRLYNTMTSSQTNIRVKLVFRSEEGPECVWANQCPGNLPVWGRCEFTSDPFSRDYDWFVAIDDVPRILPGNKEILACPRENTLLVTSEPSSVTRYGRAFSAQFSKLLTNQEATILPHPNAIRSQTGNLWFYGRTYDEIKQAPPIAKTRLISTVCSAKQQAHTMHARRYNFTQAMKQEIPELEIFGHGVRFVEKKADAIDPYQFHLVVENHIARHVWTEKLADTFLGYAVPIYCGCPNVFDYFPEDSIVPIDINDFEGSLKKIKRILSTEGEYERRLDAVQEARRRVMNEYNLPAMLDHIISEAAVPQSNEGGTIYNRQIMRVKHPADFVRFAAWRTKNLLQKLASYFKHSDKN